MAMETMARPQNPTWWSSEHESGWDRVREAFRRDWEQTKHDFGGDEPDLHQHVDDTVRQAAGKQSIPPMGHPNWMDAEPAARFGYGARRYYGSQYSAWNSDLESRLRSDWSQMRGRNDDWDQYRDSIHRGWDWDSGNAMP